MSPVLPDATIDTPHSLTGNPNVPIPRYVACICRSHLLQPIVVTAHTKCCNGSTHGKITDTGDNPRLSQNGLWWRQHRNQGKCSKPCCPSKRASKQRQNTCNRVRNTRLLLGSQIFTTQNVQPVYSEHSIVKHEKCKQRNKQRTK